MPFCFGKLIKSPPSATININESVFTWLMWKSICQVVLLTLTLFTLGFKIHLGRSDQKWTAKKHLSHLSLDIHLQGVQQTICVQILLLLCHFCKHTTYSRTVKVTLSHTLHIVH